MSTSQSAWIFSWGYANILSHALVSFDNESSFFSRLQQTLTEMSDEVFCWDCLFKLYEKYLTTEQWDPRFNRPLLAKKMKRFFARDIEIGKDFELVHSALVNAATLFVEKCREDRTLLRDIVHMVYKICHECLSIERTTIL